MIYTGTVNKLRSKLNQVVEYSLPIGTDLVPLNPLIGQMIKIESTGRILCGNCESLTKKSYSQGFCYPCMQKLACCDLCIMKPEMCHFHRGTCREPEWGEENCFVPHFVYLSNTSGLKVGITRHTQLPTRWIDQGATQAVPIYKVNTRRQSGFVEMAFKDLINDKTNWRTMLKGNAEPVDLVAHASELKQQLREKMSLLLEKFGDDEIEELNSDVVEINYPIEDFPTKIVSHNLDKNPIMEGLLKGIKGQYLILDVGVINIRKYTSYELSFSHE